MIYVTHDQVEAMAMAERIVVLEGGRVAQVGTPLELYHYPSDRFVAGFIGSPNMNFINAKVVELPEKDVVIELNNGTRLTLQVEQRDLEIGEVVSMGIRPEHIDTSVSVQCGCETESCLNQKPLVTTIFALEQLGHETQIYAEAHCLDADFIIRHFEVVDVEVGQEFKFCFPEHRCHLFRKDGSSCPRTFKEIGAKNKR